MATMSSFSVAKSAPELIVPSESTPAGNLPLSFMDRLPTMRFMVDSIHVYSHGEKPAELIRGALSKALVPYYPMAGRFAVSDDSGELEVTCTGEGMWFVQASADFTLEDVNNLELPLVIPKEEILPIFPPEDALKDVILLIQVTEFKCGGFVVGIRSDHAMGGGASFGAFMQAVVDMARGRAEPSAKPAWGREAIPNPSKPIAMGPPPAFAPMDLQKLAVDIPLDHINQLKSQYAAETGRRCSTFDVVLAKVWQCRVQAIGLPPDADVRVAFAASTVHLLKDVLPEGFYGNCGYPLTVSAPSGKVTDASMAEVVGLIRAAKDGLWEVFSRWMEGDPAADPFRAPPDYRLLGVSDWSKVGFHELDYGWGEPIHVAPVVDDNLFMATCFFLKPPAPKQGVRVLTSCVLREHFAAFHEKMTKLE